MFERPTVIILGAGASEQFGFPLGDVLVQDIIDGVGSVRRHLEGNDFPTLESMSRQNSYQFEQKPFLALASYLNSPLARPFMPEDIVSDILVERLFQFEKDLSSNPRDTLDKFIWDNPSHAFIGKVLIAARVMLRMYKQEGNAMRLRTFSQRRYDERRNWYHRLINVLRDGATDAETMQHNNLSVVTFNYDRSLDIALGRGLGVSERHSGAEPDEVLQILHVNGTVSLLPETLTDAGEFVMECANNIHLIDEEVSSDLDNVRQRARNVIFDAERLYVMGFAFDPSNVKNIGLDELQDNQSIFCLNYDGNLGVSRRIVDLGIPESAIMAPAGQGKIHIDEALGNDFLGQ